MKRKAILLMTIFLLLFFTQNVFAAQFNPPISEAFGFHWSNWDSYTPMITLGSRPPITPISTSIGNTGYNSRTFQDNTAYYVRRDMGNDALFLTISHSGPGVVQCWPTSTGVTTLLTANNTPENNVYSLQLKFSGTTELQDLRFAAFIGCNTAITDTNYGRGNLLDMSVNLGVDTVLGFYNFIAVPDQANYYSRSLYYHLTQGENYVTAVTNAEADNNAAWLGGDDVGKWAYFRGNTDGSILPVGYGQ